MDDNVRRRRRLPSLRPRRPTGAALAVLVMVSAAACSSDSSSVEPPPPQPDGPQEVRIAALLPETGPEASSGVAARWLLEERVAALNTFTANLDPGYTFELDVIDTESDPAVTREAFRDLADEGVNVVVGPFSDAEVKAVGDLAEDMGVLVASPGSSAISLGRRDNVLRFAPDDAVQAAAIVDLMRRDGVGVIAQISRDDPTNADLQAAIAADFQALGGGTIDPVLYAPDATTYDAPVDALAIAVADAREVLGPDLAEGVSVVLAGDAEVPQLLTLAAASRDLVEVRWFGSSGFAWSPDVVANPSAAAFAARAGLPSTTFGLDPATQDRWGPLVERAKEQTGIEPDVVALAAYDALDVLVTAIVESGFEAADATNAQVRDLRTEVISQSLAMEGVTGPLKLNELGDRSTGVFDFWSVCEGPTGYEWRHTAVWTPGPDGLTGGTITGTAAC